MPDDLLLIVSIALFTVGIFKFRNTNIRLTDTVFILSVSTLFFLLLAAYEVSDYFTGEGFNESVLYHLFSGLNGAGFGDYWGVMAASCILLIAGTSGTYFIYSKIISTSQPHVSGWNKYIPSILLLSALFINPVPVYFFANLLIDEGTDFDLYYNTPKISERQGTNTQPNFVFIYAEGLERTYFDENLFPGLIKELRRLESRGTSFTNIRQLWGTSSTISGMVASQCGIPLVTPSHRNLMGGMDRFLTGADCLGDLLVEEDYHLAFLGGASIDFAGKGKFYLTHGFKDVKGRRGLRSKLVNKEYMNAWGLHDDSLFDIAYSEYENLSKMNKPFGLFMLTLDTHPPRGSMSASCSGITYLDGSNPVLNSVACSDFLIGQYVEKILASKHSRNTIIFIASDHLSMKNTAYKLLHDAERTNMFMIIDPRHVHERKITAIGSTMDIGPTLLHALGYRGSIGLGRDLLAGETSLTESFDDLNESMKGWKRSLMKFWEFPQIKTNVVIDSVSEKITINNRRFDVPSLIEFDENMNTRIKFKPYRPRKQKQLIGHVSDLDSNTAFIWVDSCKTVKFDKSNTGLCVLTGKLGARNLTGFRVNGKKVISLDSLRQIILSRTSEEFFRANKQKLLN